MSYNSLLGLGSHSEDANLLCHLTLQESSGTTCDDRSSNAYDGTLTGETDPTTATGPNSYLTSAFDMDGTDDRITLNASTIVGGSSARTYMFWFRPDTSFNGRFADWGINTTATSGRNLAAIRNDADQQLRLYFSADHVVKTPTNSVLDNTWYHIGVRVPATVTNTDDVDALIDGVNQTLSLQTGSAQTLNTDNTSNRYLGGGISNASPLYADGKFAGYCAFSRALSDAEVLEIASGPEPENTVAPTVSGSTAQGSTLTCSPGTWALPSPFASGSNGTITYQYQWTRDGGDISGATSSTYVTQVADVGTAVGCKVLGVNDGGSDSAEQTASSNTISVVSSGPTYQMNMQLFIPTQV